MTLASGDALRIGLEVAAMAAFAVSGIVEALRKRMDVVGVTAVAFVTAFGGGTLRDLLLDRRPFFWASHVEYVWLTLALGLCAGMVFAPGRMRLTERAIVVPDAIGLGLFAVSGTASALAAGMPAIVAAILGVVTATFGGVLRDVLCNELPVVFTDRRPYALCAFAGAWAFIALAATPLDPVAASLASVGLASGLRLLAVARDWRLPEWPAQP